MNLKNKRELAAKVLNVGKNRIYFNQNNLKEISEAITRQDILDLYNQGIIKIKEKKGRRKVQKRKYRRRTGKIKKKVDKSKQNYVKLTRKLRKILKMLKLKGEITKEKYEELRKKIKASKIKSKRHLMEVLKEK